LLDVANDMFMRDLDMRDLDMSVPPEFMRGLGLKDKLHPTQLKSMSASNNCRAGSVLA